MLTWKTFREILNKENLEINYSHVKSLLRNEVLYLAGLVNDELRNTEEWGELSRRRELQLNALMEFVDVAEKLGVEYVVVKTFKLFPYIPDDIDILVLNSSRINDVVSELTKRNFKVRSKGTSEFTLSKVAHKTFADLDIHFKIAAGEYIYYPTELVWQNRRRMLIDGNKVNVASWEDECVLTIAHAIMKEFEILASDILQVMLCKKKGFIKSKHLKETGHVKTYGVFSGIFEKIIRNNELLPYRISLWEISLVYAYNIAHRIYFEKLKPLREIIAFPRARGIKKLVFA